MPSLRIAAVSLPNAGSPRDRYALAVRAADRAVDAGARWVLFQETLFPGYPLGIPGRESGRDDTGLLAAHLVERGVGAVIGFAGADGAGRLGSDVLLAWPGGKTVVRKRFPTPREGLRWRPGREAARVRTPDGVFGVLVCADVLQIRAWDDLRGVDLVFVASAWPDGHAGWSPPGLGWVRRDAVRYRERLLDRASRALDVPVAFANVRGPGFSGGTGLRDRRGATVGERIRVDDAEVVVGDLETGGGGREPLRHEGRWAAFLPAYGWLGRVGR